MRLATAFQTFIVAIIDSDSAYRPVTYKLPTGSAPMKVNTSGKKLSGPVGSLEFISHQ
jgi:hypothetical protein